MMIQPLENLIPLNDVSKSATVGLNGKLEKMTQEQMRLKNACREFESVMVSTLMKESLAAAEEMGKVGNQEESGDSGSKTYKDLAWEQMSLQIGRSGMLGIGDMLYNSVKDRVNVKGDTVK